MDAHLKIFGKFSEKLDVIDIRGKYFLVENVFLVNYFVVTFA